MEKIEIKNRFTGKIIFEFSKENNTIKDTVKEYIKKELESGKSSADLSSADLRSADLSDADLSSADLRSANLHYANLDKRYISITRIGSNNRMTTYCFEDDVIWCGCFKGTLSEFESKVNETHKYNELYLKQYIGAINYIKSLK